MKNVLRSGLAVTFGLLFAVALGAPAGCASIVGADDYQVGPAGATAGSEIVGQAGTSISGVGGADVGGSMGSGGTRLGGGGERDLDAAASSDVLVKKESSIDPMEDARRSDVVVVDTGKPMPTGSGESTCSTTCASPGLSCIHTTWGPTGLCLYGCPNSNSECDANHACIHAKDPAVGLDYSCLKTCPNGICPAGMVCLPLSTVSICEPTDWFPKNLGLGDDCFFDAQCKSGQCYKKPNGWCSEPCSSANDLCAGDYSLGANYYGELNWCVNTGGSYRCIPGCDNFDIDCDNYPGTTCTSITDVNGLTGYACR